MTSCGLLLTLLFYLSGILAHDLSLTHDFHPASVLEDVEDLLEKSPCAPFLPVDVFEDLNDSFDLLSGPHVDLPFIEPLALYFDDDPADDLPVHWTPITTAFEVPRGETMARALVAGYCFTSPHETVSELVIRLSTRTKTNPMPYTVIGPEFALKFPEAASLVAEASSKVAHAAFSLEGEIQIIEASDEMDALPETHHFASHDEDRSTHHFTSLRTVHPSLGDGEFPFHNSGGYQFHPSSVEFPRRSVPVDVHREQPVRDHVKSTHTHHTHHAHRTRSPSSLHNPHHFPSHEQEEEIEETEDVEDVVERTTEYDSAPAVTPQYRHPPTHFVPGRGPSRPSSTVSSGASNGFYRPRHVAPLKIEVTEAPERPSTLPFVEERPEAPETHVPVVDSFDDELSSSLESSPPVLPKFLVNSGIVQQGMSRNEVLAKLRSFFEEYGKSAAPSTSTASPPPPPLTPEDWSLKVQAIQSFPKPCSFVVVADASTAPKRLIGQNIFEKLDSVMPAHRVSLYWLDDAGVVGECFGPADFLDFVDDAIDAVKVPGLKFIDEARTLSDHFVINTPTVPAEVLKAIEGAKITAMPNVEDLKVPWVTNLITKTLDYIDESHAAKSALDRWSFSKFDEFWGIMWVNGHHVVRDRTTKLSLVMPSKRALYRRVLIPRPCEFIVIGEIKQAMATLIERTLLRFLGFSKTNVMFRIDEFEEVEGLCVGKLTNGAVAPVHISELTDHVILTDDALAERVPEELNGVVPLISAEIRPDISSAAVAALREIPQIHLALIFDRASGDLPPQAASLASMITYFVGTGCSVQHHYFYFHGSKPQPVVHPALIPVFMLKGTRAIPPPSDSPQLSSHSSSESPTEAAIGRSPATVRVRRLGHHHGHHAASVSIPSSPSTPSAAEDSVL